MSKVRVLSFTHWGRNGITSLINSIQTGLPEYDHAFVLLTKDDNFYQYYSHCENKIQLAYDNSKVDAFLKLKKFLKAFNPEIIHVHSFTPLLYLYLCKVTAKVIFHTHSEYPYFYKTDIKSKIKRFLIKIICKRLNARILAVTENAANRLQEFTHRQCTYIPNGIAELGTQRENFVTEPNKNRFYTVGRLDTAKNVSYAISLIEGLNKQGITASLDIYGMGDQYDNLLAQINTLQLANQVRLMGFTTEPHNLPSQYDFYLSTSIQEGLSLSILHALRGKTPTITTLVGQLAIEIQKQFPDLALTGNINADLNRVKTALTMSAPHLTNIQETGQRLFKESFTQEIFLKKIGEIYQQ